MSAARVTERAGESVEAAARRAEATARHWHGVHELLERRSDLEGVVPLADLIHSAVHWAA